MYQQQPQRQVIEQGANHTLHIILSIFTCGLWLPIWAIAAMVGRKKTVTTYGVGPQPYAPSRIPPIAYPPRGQYGPPGYGYPQPQQGEQQQPPTG